MFLTIPVGRTRNLFARERIANNFSPIAPHEDWGCVGIGIGYVREVAIEHNEVNNLSYTGISLGWGWTQATNAAQRQSRPGQSRSSRRTAACAISAEFTRSPRNPAPSSPAIPFTIFRLSPYVLDPSHWFYVYLDEGSSFITVRDNWCPRKNF